MNDRPEKATGADDPSESLEHELQQSASRLI
jgi:hypothetical protein